ncbi:hypothetical protein [Bradyrhizobium sp. 18]|uniref:hypothetical protein n=1 Tax=Bradyrhizobium sp. 18 TaxID=2782657 RepID=UPI001FF80C36|nr:hypothetical protein [Bradyrhizobium sp. 18]
MSRSLLVTWRRAFAANRTKSEAGFVRAIVADGRPLASVAASSQSAAAHSTERRIEIELAGGRRVIADAGVDIEALRRIIEALDPR